MLEEQLKRDTQLYSDLLQNQTLIDKKEKTKH